MTQNKSIRIHLKKCVQRGLKKCDCILFYRINSERNLEKLSKAKLINLVEKLQNKTRKPKIAIVDDDNGQVPQPQKLIRHVPPRDPKTGRFIKIHPDRPKPPKQPTLPRLRDDSFRDGSQNP